MTSNSKIVSKTKNLLKNVKAITKDQIKEMQDSFKYSPKLLDKNTGDANFKVMSWNVAGLRAFIKKFEPDNIIELLKKQSINVLCLQETKCTEDQILPLRLKMQNAGYNLYSDISEKAGYCGVFCFSSEKPVRVIKGLEENGHERGRCLTLEFSNFFLVNLYVANGGSGLKKLDYRVEKFDVGLRNFAQKLMKDKPVILAGDMNVSILDYDLANPKTNLRTPGFTIEERSSFTELLDLGFYDMYRAFYPDKKDAYTYWAFFRNCRAKNIGWRLDYFLCSEAIKDKVIDTEILSDYTGSDHCPITLSLNL